ncbi:MAG: SMC family ATPase, partial [Candidatus Babeliales bacterium]
TLRSERSLWKKNHQLSLLYKKKAQSLEELREALSTKINIHQQKHSKSLELKEKLLHVKEQIHQRHLLIEKEHTKARHEQELSLERILLHYQSEEHEQEKLTQQIAITQKEITALKTKLSPDCSGKEKASVSEMFTKNESLFEKRKSAYHQFVAQANIITIELQQLHNKTRLVKNDTDPSCPLCEQKLSQSRKTFLKQTFLKKKARVQHRRERLARLITSLKELLVQQNKLLLSQRETLEQLRQTTEAIQQKEVVLNDLLLQQNRRQQTLIKTAQEITTQKEKVAQISNNYHTESNADATHQQLKQNLQNLEAENALIEYHKEQHGQDETQLQSVNKELENYHLLKQELPLQKKRLQHIIELCATIKHYRNDIATFKTALTTYSSWKQEEKKLYEFIEQEKQQQEQITQRKNQLLEQRGSLEEKLKQLTECDKESSSYAERIKDNETNIHDYTIIASATSQDGIQALLIEETIPELEHEANYLLGRLTNNQTHMRINSLRDLKKGGTKETLDITISDPIGIRPYELFSGGEAFRIDFALRIAISKLLARRAGTSLQTLIIDEGFGSQDEEGLAHLMNALHIIQDDFAKIIVVSHLESMKNQFPVHFYIEKKSTGSVLRVIENG